MTIGNYKSVFIVTGCTLLLAVGIVFYTSQNRVVVDPMPQKVQKAIQLPDKTVSWKTYKNLGVEFKYPGDATFKEDTNGSTQDTVDFKVGNKEFAFDRISSQSENEAPYNQTKIIKMFHGVLWKVVPPEQTSEYCDAGNCGKTAPGYYVYKNGFRYGLYYYSDDLRDTIEQILSTFTFLEKPNSQSSGSLFSNDQTYQVNLVSDNAQPSNREVIPCNPKNSQLTSVKGDYYLTMQKSLTEPIVSTLPIGNQTFFGTTEQDGHFTEQVLQRSPKYSAFSLAKRSSCNTTTVRLFGVNPKTNTLIEYVAYGKNGLPYPIQIPSGKKIPQQDTNLNIISDTYNQSTGKHDKVRYGFDPDRLALYEIESWSQVQTDSETSNWKTYTNKNVGVEFK